MDFSQLFLQRHDVLYDFLLADIWEKVPEDLMRQRPDPRVNSIAWIIWHFTRGEDAGLNRFVVDRPQILDEGAWVERMNLPWRHHGSGMTLAEVDELDQRIDLQALHAYSNAVRQRTHEIVSRIDQVDLGDILSPERTRMIVIDEGLGHPSAIDLAEWYAGWTKGRCLMNFGLSHPYQHVGEIGVIASLLGVVFD